MKASVLGLLMIIGLSILILISIFFGIVSLLLTILGSMLGIGAMMAYDELRYGN